jgi:INO80 complex subunit B
MADGGRRAEGRSMDSRSSGQSKLTSEGPNGVQVKTLVDGRTSHSRDSDMKALDKSVLRQDDLPSQEGRLTKVKLKVGGVTHTIHANSTGNAGGIKQKGLEGSSASAKPPQATEGGRRRQRLILQENSDDEDDFPVRVEMQESPKELQFYTSASIAKMDIHAKEITPGKQTEMTNNVVAGQPVRKSARIPKKRILDGEHDEDDDGEEASQRKSSRNPKKRVPIGEYEEDEEGHETPQRRSSRMPKKRMLDAEYDEDDEEDEGQQHKRRLRRPKYERDSEDLYQEDDEEEAASADEDAEIVDVELEGKKKRSRRKQEVGNSTFDDKKEAPLTARQRAMQSCKDVVSEVGANLIEFPEGLPQTSQRKRKEKLSEVEQQLKKAEAAQRRKMQVEKAANEIQAEAIKKILGQDSIRKKREDKLRKQRDEMAQEKAASAMMLASNSVRWVMGPSGTVVSFSENTGLPSIFNSGPCRYPPPREKCAGPLCNNTYKYRDSKSKLPLCSLQCYRAIHDVTHPVSTC